MRFLYTGPFRFPNGDAAASRVLNNIRILHTLGHQVDVLSFGGQYLAADKTTTGYLHDGIPYTITHDIDTHSWGERLRRYFLPPKQAWQRIKSTLSHYDAVIVYNPNLALNSPLIRRCKRLGKKLIGDFTEWYAPTDFPGGKCSPIYWLSEWNMRVVQKRYRNIIPISHYLSDYYQQANRVILPPLICCDDAKWSTTLTDIPEEIAAFSGKKIIFAGVPGKKDLLSNLVQAALQVIKEGLSVQIIVVGVDNSQRAHFFQDESFLSYSNHFVFLGRKPQEQIPGYYHLADFSAIIREPNRKNSAGFPTKMAESMASGCPVLLNATSDLSDYVADGQNAILLSDYRVETIASRLRELVALSPDQIAQMKERARQVARKRFDYRQYTQEVAAFLTSLK